MFPIFMMAAVEPPPLFESQIIFPLEGWHNHGSSIVECPNGDLLVCWFHGSGERTADDVQILGARKRKGAKNWSAPFPMADTQGFPDCNPVMFIDPLSRLWLVRITILNHQWESSLLKALISTDYQKPGAPKWGAGENIHIKPDDEEFPRLVHEDCDRQEKQMAYISETLQEQALNYLKDRRQKADDKLTRRLGWMTRIHPLIIQQNGKPRILLPLYSDGFDFSIIGISDDNGTTWQASRPIISIGGVQPSLVQRKDGVICAYMRDNGLPPKRVMYAESADGGYTWGTVKDLEVFNPGSSVEVIKLSNGDWLFIGNDTEAGRHQLVAMLSDDEGKTWRWKRYVERDEPGAEAGSYSYPSVIQAKDGTIHLTYSYAINKKDLPLDTNNRPKRAAIKWVRFSSDWVKAGD